MFKYFCGAIVPEQLSLHSVPVPYLAPVSIILGKYHPKRNIDSPSHVGSRFVSVSGKLSTSLAVCNSPANISEVCSHLGFILTASRSVRRTQGCTQSAPRRFRSRVIQGHRAGQSCQRHWPAHTTGRCLLRTMRCSTGFPG